MLGCVSSGYVSFFRLGQVVWLGRVMLG